MPDITVQEIDSDGLTVSYTSADAGGDTATNTGRDFIHILNGDASPMTVTIDSQLDCDQGVDHNFAVVVAATSEQMIGPFPKPRFNNASDKITITYSSVTSLTLAMLKLS